MKADIEQVMGILFSIIIEPCMQAHFHYSVMHALVILKFVHKIIYICV